MTYAAVVEEKVYRSRRPVRVCPDSGQVGPEDHNFSLTQLAHVLCEKTLESGVLSTPLHENLPRSQRGMKSEVASVNHL